MENTLATKQKKLNIWSMVTAGCTGATLADLIVTISDPNTINVISTCVCALVLACSGYKTRQASKDLSQFIGKQR